MKCISCLPFPPFVPHPTPNPSSIPSHQSPSNQWCRTESQSDSFPSLLALVPTVIFNLSFTRILWNPVCAQSTDPIISVFASPQAKVEGAFWTLLIGCLFIHEPNPNLLWCQKNSLFEQRIATQTVNNSLFKMCVCGGGGGRARRRMYFISLMTLEPNLRGVVR